MIIGPRIQQSIVLGGIVAFVACDARVELADAPFTIRDSAGISIVESRRPIAAGADGWLVDSVPFLAIGEVDGEQPYLMNGVSDVQALEDGRVLLANRSDESIRIYDIEGRFLVSFGGDGQGPGEFTGLAELRAVDSEIVGYHAGGRGWERFSSAGELLGSIRIRDLPEVLGLQVWDALSDGSPVLGAIPRSPPVEPGMPRIVTSQMAIYVASINGSRTDSIAAITASRFVNVGSSLLRQPLGGLGLVAASSQNVYAGWPDSHEVRVVDRAGALVRIIRWSGVLHEVTNADRVAFLQDYVRPGGAITTSGGFVDQAEVADRLLFPETYPSFNRLLVDATDHLWVRRVQPTRTNDDPPTWDVFDPDGVWVSTVETPPGFSVHSIGRDHLAGRLLDALRVERAALIRLIRDGDAG